MDQSASRPIGVLDSGVGGLTVVRELRRLLPGEDIVYFGDNANCPYGNNTTEQMLDIAHNMLRFLRDKNCKMVVLACNTISSMLDLVQGYDFPLLSIITPVCRAIAAKPGLREVGVIATVLTTRSRGYENQIIAHNPRVKVWAEASRDLARLVDCGDFDMNAIDRDVRDHVGALLDAHPAIEEIVLGCTHYPIVGDAFRCAAPHIMFIDPAGEQVAEARRILDKAGQLAEREQGALHIYTSGGSAVYPVYEGVLARLGIAQPYTLHEVD